MLELEHTKRVIGLNRHVTVMSTVALQVAIAGVTSLIPHTTKILPSFPSMGVSFISVCRLVFVE
jgi:hypothetical protein